MWTGKETLKEALLALPEPVMIVGNKTPDADSLGSCAAVLEFMRFAGKEAYIHCVREPDVTIAWMIDTDDTNASIEEDYASLVVLDDVIEGQRLGIEIRDVPIVNVDHHHSNFGPEKLKILYGGRKPAVFVEDNAIRYLAIEPATASLLVLEGIFHPYLWASIYSDSVGFTVNCRAAIGSAARLMVNLPDTTETDYELQIKAMKPVVSLDALETFLEGSIYTVSGMHEGKPVQVVITTLDKCDGLAYRAILGNLARFGNIYGVVNKQGNKVSLRSDRYEFSVMDICKEYGGGGHIRAAGCTLPGKSTFTAECDELIGKLAERLESPRIKIYV